MVFAAFGALIGSIAGDTRSTVLWSQLIFLPSMLLGGLMLPVDLLPIAMLPVAGFVPTTYAMQAYQGLAFGTATVWDPALSLGLLAAAGLLAFTLAIYLFNWDSRNNSRRGHPALGLIALAPFVIGDLIRSRTTPQMISASLRLCVSASLRSGFCWLAKPLSTEPAPAPDPNML